MKVSREWLQKFFEKPLPEAQILADALTFHAFEIESVENDILDVKVLPNRGHDCLSHRGIAKELSAILDVKLVAYPYGITNTELEPKTDALKIVVENPQLCPRFSAAYIAGLKVEPSPEWLRKALESVGQKSINNIVDATNYVMFDIGQPLHAFDAAKLSGLELTVRSAKNGEKMLGLDEKEYSVGNSMLVITNRGIPVSIAGIKGGKPTGIDESTTSIVIEAANWDGPMIRKTSATLKLRTDASERFQQIISPELTAYGLKAAAELIVKLAGGNIEGYVDEYPAPQEKRVVSISKEKVNNILGTKFTDSDVENTFHRLGLPFSRTEEVFNVDVPFERLDITISEDLVEEVARIVGYDAIPSTALPPPSKKPNVNLSFYAAEKKREELMTEGYSEVYTSVFAESGERAVANKVGGEKPFLRTTLVGGLREAYERNSRNVDLLGLKVVKLFEVGTIWKGGKEITMVGSADGGGVREEPLSIVESRAYDALAVSTTERYEPFSKYPFIVRDISLWIPPQTTSAEVRSVIEKSTGELLQRLDVFDEYSKGEKHSVAFRLVLQSFEKTLTDEEANSVMERVYETVKRQGWEVR